MHCSGYEARQRDTEVLTDGRFHQRRIVDCSSVMHQG